MGFGYQIPFLQNILLVLELIEIKGLFEMDLGSPSPLILSNENELFVTFYFDGQVFSKIPQERNTIYDTGVIVLKFRNYLKYTFGMPGEETIQGHPYSKLGMQSYSFYELEGSDLIERLQSIEEVHPEYDSAKWQQYKHHILTFHDNMFECVSQGFELTEKDTSLYKEASTLLNEISTNHF